jgi:hypothetical protein
MADLTFLNSVQSVETALESVAIPTQTAGTSPSWNNPQGGSSAPKIITNGVSATYTPLYAIALLMQKLEEIPIVDTVGADIGAAVTTVASKFGELAGKIDQLTAPPYPDALATLDIILGAVQSLPGIPNEFITVSSLMGQINGLLVDTVIAEKLLYQLQQQLNIFGVVLSTPATIVDDALTFNQ